MGAAEGSAGAPQISVCIASAGRRSGLARALRALAAQALPAGLRFETLVVDNSAAGGLREALEAEGPPLPGLRWLREPEPNVALARNAALDAAAGAWLAFVDDDEEPAPDWLAAYWRAAQAHPADGYFGPVRPRFEPGPGAPQALLRRHARPRHATGAWVPRAELRSGNAFLRASLLRGRRFDREFGLGGGEDSELFGRLQAGGALFVWCDEAAVVEWLPRERQRARWLLRRSYRAGISATRLAWRSGGPTAALRGLPRALLGCAIAALRLALALPRGSEAALARARDGALQLGHLAAYLVSARRALASAIQPPSSSDAPSSPTPSAARPGTAGS